MTVKGGASEVFSRSNATRIPKRIEALFITFADTRSNSLLLSRDELDINPATKLLPNEEKEALVKYWPQFRENQQLAREIRENRERDMQLVLKAQKDASLIRKKEGLDNMTTPERLKAVSHVMVKQVENAAITLSVMHPDEVHTDPLTAALYKSRVQYVRDFIWIAKNLVDLSDRLEEYTTDDMQSVELTNEAQEMLRQADIALIRKGAGHLSASQVVLDGDGGQ
ncbi:MAG: hypothetical protein V4757_06640 [Pseudomonadota bacterium]